MEGRSDPCEWHSAAPGCPVWRSGICPATDGWRSIIAEMAMDSEPRCYLTPMQMPSKEIVRRLNSNQISTPVNLHVVVWLWDKCAFAMSKSRIISLFWSLAQSVAQVEWAFEMLPYCTSHRLSHIQATFEISRMMWLIRTSSPISLVQND